MTRRPRRTGPYGRLDPVNGIRANVHMADDIRDTLAGQPVDVLVNEIRLPVDLLVAALLNTGDPNVLAAGSRVFGEAARACRTALADLTPQETPHGS
jgi:hypothetical protein